MKTQTRLASLGFIALLLTACGGQDAGPAINSGNSAGSNSSTSGKEGNSTAGGPGASMTTGGTPGAETGGVDGSTGGVDGGGATPESGGEGDPGSGGGGSQAHYYPSDILPELTLWKLTLPVDENGDDSSLAANVNQRNTEAYEVVGNGLVDYEYIPYFLADDDEVFFRAHVGGATTSGSKYPRSELRQLVGGGDNYWSVEEPQNLDVHLRVTHLPVEKPEVSMVQIHGPENEPLRVQYHEDIGVYIIWNEDNEDEENALAYALGERLHITVEVEAGDITTTIRNLDRATSYTRTWASADATGYFKVGCYTQSSLFLSEFKDGYQNEPEDAYGEIAVSSIALTETYE